MVIDAAVNNKHYTTRDIAGIGKEKHPSLFCRGFGRDEEENKFFNIEFCSLFYKIFILVVDANAIYKPYTTHGIAGIGKEKHTSLFHRRFGHNKEEEKVL